MAARLVPFPAGPFPCRQARPGLAVPFFPLTVGPSPSLRWLLRFPLLSSVASSVFGWMIILHYPFVRSIPYLLSNWMLYMLRSDPGEIHPPWPRIFTCVFLLSTFFCILMVLYLRSCVFYLFYSYDVLFEYTIIFQGLFKHTY